MSFFDYFKSKKKNTANVAKERLQIIVAHERGMRDQPDYLPQLQQELIAVIRKYVQIDDDMVQVELDRNDDCSVLELNVTLPEHQQ
ncbi:cell division topological specificity factor MinE [Marinobacter sp. R17]|uniref:cell division topological specificity factor MinE n=1 Tax=Marinobacter TaxID=2742 RepID=UPI000F4C5786|nr:MULTISPECIES: cell division topological specificity factor MinE [Marinobacter]ROT97918.1 cell division topological specificity factor MinE [Marinobacter sp. R17]